MRARGPKAAHIALLFPDSLEDAGPEGKIREKTEKHQQNRRKTSKKVAATSEKVVEARGWYYPDCMRP